MSKIVYLIILFWGSTGLLMAATGTINTVAGDGTSGFSGDGGPATSAELDSPYSVSTDSSNNIYICDFGNNRIRKVNALTGVITTVAGNGTYGYNGDGIAATTAELSNPLGVCVDKCGNIYFAEYGGNRVRRVDATTGLISTVAGTGTAGYNGDGILATTAQLNVPHDTALDSQGRLYIADRSNYRCRRVDPVTGLISTVAGSGSGVYGGDGGPATSAGMGWVEGVWVDSTGNIYLAISTDGNIRKVNGATGVISTFATGVGYPLDVSGDCGGDIFVGTGDAQVYEVNSGGVVSTVAGTGTGGFSGDGGPATSAELDYPCGVNVDTLGDLLIVDNVNVRVRLVQTIATPCPVSPCGTPTPTPTVTATPTPNATPTGEAFQVNQNMLNPSGPPVSIYVSTSLYPGQYGLRIYNSAGEHIKTLDSKQLSGPLSQWYSWDGKNKYGNTCASGVYIIYLEEPFGTQTKRIMLVR
jgi:sugar lactone lactonase YvrE